MHYYIGLDNGGTATKAALFDEHGNEIGVAAVSTEAITPKPGFVERDMEEMWQANCRVLRDVLRKTNTAPSDVAGVGIAGHGKGLYLWGKDGAPVRNGIISTDNRAWRYPVRWKEDGTEEKAFELTLQHILSCQPVSLLAWLKENEPDNYAKIGYVFECKDYVRFRLTGEAMAERTDYSGSGLMNLKTGTYDSRILDLFGIPEVEEALPPLCGATEICGYVTDEAAALSGLAPGTPVIGGMFDINACAIAAGVTDSDKLCMIAGTWSINEYIRRDPVDDGTVQMNSIFALPGWYLVEESSPTSAGNFEWFIRQLLPELKEKLKAEGSNIYDYVNKQVEAIAPEEFVPVFLPFLMASNEHPTAKGTFVGMNVSHTRNHLLRSLYEGVVFSHRRHFERLMASRNEKPSVIRLAGGAARSQVWAQMFADVMQLPVQTLEANETGALGCAIAAAAATGAYKSIDEAIGAMSAFSDPIMPRTELREIYDRKYHLYVRTVECLDGLWDEMQQFAE